LEVYSFTCKAIPWTRLFLEKMVDGRHWKNSCFLSNMKILSLESFCTRPFSDVPSLQWISWRGGGGWKKEGRYF
jgi:hypothetical protein